MKFHWLSFLLGAGVLYVVLNGKELMAKFMPAKDAGATTTKKDR